MNNFEERFLGDLQRVPSVPTDTLPAIEHRIHQRAVIKRVRWSLAAVLVMTIGLGTYSIHFAIQQRDAAVAQAKIIEVESPAISNGANAELEYACDFVNGHTIDKELTLADVVEPEIY